MSAATVRHFAQQACFVGMETLGFVALAYLLGTRGTTVPLALLLLIGWLLLAFNRWLYGLALWESVQGKALSVLSGLIAISLLMGLTVPEIGLIAGPADWLTALSNLTRYTEGDAPRTTALVAGFILMIRVLDSVRTPIGPRASQRRLSYALIGLILYLFVLASRGGAFPLAFVGLFAAFALLSLILTRAHSLSDQPGVSPLPLTPRWVVMVGGAVLAVILLWAVTEGVGVQLLRSAGTLIQPFVMGLAWLLARVVQVVLWILSPLFNLLDSLFPELVIPERTPAEEQQQAAGEETVTLYSVDTDWAQLIFVAILIIVALWLLSSVLRVYRERRRAEHRTEASYAAGDASLGAWWRRQREALSNLFARRARPDFGVETVRDLYKNLLAFGEEQAIPRPHEATPYEYLPLLARRFPDAGAEFRALTDAYVATQYGNHAFTRAEVEQLRLMWQRLQTIAQE